MRSHRGSRWQPLSPPSKDSRTKWTTCLHYNINSHTWMSWVLVVPSMTIRWFLYKLMITCSGQLQTYLWEVYLLVVLTWFLLLTYLLPIPFNIHLWYYLIVCICLQYLGFDQAPYGTLYLPAYPTGPHLQNLNYTLPSGPQLRNLFPATQDIMDETEANGLSSDEDPEDRAVDDYMHVDLDKVRQCTSCFYVHNSNCNILPRGRANNSISNMFCDTSPYCRG